MTAAEQLSCGPMPECYKVCRRLMLWVIDRIEN